MGVCVSFLMVGHVQNQSIFLIAEKCIQIGKCFGYLYPVSSGVNYFYPLRNPIVPRCQNFQKSFGPDQSWAIV